MSSPLAFRKIGISMWHNQRNKKAREYRARATFRSLFGCSPDICVKLWNFVIANHGATEAGVKPKHLLWALHFLKLYNPVRASAAMIGCKWVWIVLTALTEVGDVIGWENRNIGHTAGQSSCRVSVDGTDFRIQEPRKPKFDKKWFSHKFKGPGLRYEVGIAIHTGWIVWINGPFPCGEWPDLKIANEDLIGELDEGEKFVADNGYRTAGLYSVTPKDLHDVQQKRLHQRVRARHEIVNGRFKNWGTLKNTFSASLGPTWPCFWCSGGDHPGHS